MNDAPLRLIAIADIEAAARLLTGLVVRTPMLRSHTLSKELGCQAWVKFENLQFTASFKERGAVVKLASLSPDERRRGVIAMSAGNHAQGVAYHAGILGIPATIVMPSFTPYSKVRHTQAHGARVVLHGDTLTEAADEAHRLARSEGRVFVHPYDDAMIVAGQGTVALEMLQDAPELDTLVVPVGGGGLISGCAVAARAIRPGIRIVGVETAGYPALYQHLHGQPISAGGETIAEGIAVRDTGALPLALCRELVDEVVLVDEEHIERAIVMYIEIEKTVAEGAGAAALAAVLADREAFAGRHVGLVLSGGNIDTRLLASILMRGLVRDGRIVRLRIKINDRPGQLARVTRIVADIGANVLEVAHQRLFGGVAAKSATLEVTIETRDAAQVRDLIAALEAAGYKVKLLEGTAEG
jgi:threonine dehydratase